MVGRTRRPSRVIGRSVDGDAKRHPDWLHPLVVSQRTCRPVYEGWTTATGIAVTDKVNDRLDSPAAALGLRTKEGLAHAILELALTNPTLKSQAAAMSRLRGDEGSRALEKMGL